MSKLNRREFLQELSRLGRLGSAGLLAGSLPMQLQAQMFGKSKNTTNYGIWIPTSATNALVSRYEVTATWDSTNGKAIFWGGFDGTSAYNDGKLYDPVTDSWANLSASGLAARYLHTQVFCGGKTVIWGGLAGIYQNDGAMWNGSTWTATSVAGSVPAARYDHTATDCGGGIMAVWGGVGVSTYGNGAVLDVGTNSWTTINATGAPAARRQHSAVWTGSKLIIWGGFNGSTLSTGGVFNPTSWGAGTWTATTGTAAPAARYEHTAIWTGSKMIVWGGGNGTTGMNDGAAYDPAGDSWTAIATNSAIGPRMGHSAYWTGTEMIIFGGFTGTIYYNDGWAYNPTSNTWRPLFLTDADRTVTVTTGSPGTINLTAHGYLTNEQVVLVATSAPTGLTNGAIYYVNAPTSNTFQVKSTIGGASINITSAGSAVKFRRLFSTVRQPSIRSNFGSTWIPTRKDLVVWGGKDVAGAMNTGGVLRVYF